MKRRYVLLVAVALALCSCGKKPEPTPEPQPDPKPVFVPELQFSEESQAAIDAPITFDASGNPVAGQSGKLHFTATEAWTAIATDSWLTVQPASGAAGTVEVVLSAEANPDTEKRGCSLAFECGSTSIGFSVYQEAAEPVDPPEPPLAVPEAIDMGLSVKWASFNVGAAAPEEDGDYYAWGETALQSEYSWASYRFTEGNGQEPLTKYNTSEYAGPIDYLIILEEEDDIAHVKYGEPWRIPTKTEMSELIEHCDMEWRTQDGVSGVLLTSTINGNSLFFPASGCCWNGVAARLKGEQGNYWSSSILTESPRWAASLNFSETRPHPREMTYKDRYFGMSIRPVYGTPDVIHPEGVMIVPGSIEIEVGETVQLEAVVLPQNATDKSVTWTVSSFENHIKVSPTGEVMGLRPTDWSSAVVEVTTNDYLYTAQCSVRVKSKSALVPVPEAVDLGLASGTKWASFNVGAAAPEEYGYYYAWGETELKSEYSWGSYSWCEGDSGHITKYKSEGETLDPADDVAAMCLGGQWRMPTADEQEELLRNCDWLWTSLNGTNGYRVTSKRNGNSIFFPAAGRMDGVAVNLLGEYVFCWSSTLVSTSDANCIAVDAAGSFFSWYYVATHRYYGLPVRAVTK